MKRLLGSLILALIMIPLSGQAGLTVIEKDNMTFMLEEEQLARDVYLTFASIYDHHIFTNISQAEQRHLDMVLSRMEGLEAQPQGTPAEQGKFRNQELQKLYDELVARGRQSFTEALRVGALIEEKDIIDLQESIEASANEADRELYTRLMRASENHLRAFNKNLQKQGVTYAPVMLDTEAFDAIISSANQHQCAGDCNHGPQKGKGMGKGQGQGKGMHGKGQQGQGHKCNH